MFLLVYSVVFLRYLVTCGLLLGMLSTVQAESYFMLERKHVFGGVAVQTDPSSMLNVGFLGELRLDLGERFATSLMMGYGLPFLGEGSGFFNALRVLYYPEKSGMFFGMGVSQINIRIDRLNKNEYLNATMLILGFETAEFGLLRGKVELIPLIINQNSSIRIGEAIIFSVGLL